MPSEKELDRAFETAIQQNGKFRAWFLSQTKHGSDYPDLVLTNSRHLWGKVRVMLADPETGALGFHDREGETDILLVFAGSRGRLGIHVENKTGSRVHAAPAGVVCRTRRALAQQRQAWELRYMGDGAVGAAERV